MFFYSQINVFNIIYAQNVRQSPMRKLYTECDLRRVGLQSCSSHIVRTPSNPVPPSVTDNLAAVSPPNYGSVTARNRRHIASASAAAAAAAADDDDDDGGCSPLMSEMTSFEMPPSAGSPTWRWSNQWSRFRAWLTLDALALADSIDKYSRVGFPFVFTVLSVVYWVIYLQIRPAEYEDDFVMVE